MDLRALLHRIRGRKQLFQVYANITYSTPESCLEHHGKIVPDKKEVPEPAECDFEVLSFPVGELSHYREKKERMEELAEREVERRELFREGVGAIEREDFEAGIALFERSVKIDVFLPEIESFAGEQGEEIPPEPSQRLKEIFVLGYKEKFGQKRYERLPEKMREDRKEAGVKKIRELFG